MWIIITEIIIGIIATVAIFVGYYFNIKAKAIEAASQAIDEIENDNKLKGEDKLNEAVDTLYGLIPVAAKLFISRKMMKFIVQSTFNRIESYAKKQCNNKKK